MEQQEQWKDVVGFEGRYQVSNIGRIKRLDHVILRKDGTYQAFKEMILARVVDKDGYILTSLSKNSKAKLYKAHRLVASAFIGEIGDGMQINHINGIKDDNRVENLEICTPSENSIHAYHTLGRKLSGAAVDCGKPITGFYIKPRANQKIKPEADVIFRSFGSAEEAAVFIRRTAPVIRNAMRSKRTAGGYFWMLNEDIASC